MVAEQVDVDADHVADADNDNDENEQDCEGKDVHGDDYEIEDEDVCRLHRWSKRSIRR